MLLSACREGQKKKKKNQTSSRETKTSGPLTTCVRGLGVSHTTHVFILGYIKLQDPIIMLEQDWLLNIESCSIFCHLRITNDIRN